MKSLLFSWVYNWSKRNKIWKTCSDSKHFFKRIELSFCWDCFSGLEVNIFCPFVSYPSFFFQVLSHFQLEPRPRRPAPLPHNRLSVRLFFLLEIGRASCRGRV